MASCPYCQQPVSSVTSRLDCPQCQQRIFSVPCPECGRRTLNLTLWQPARPVTCFACHHAVTHLPGTEPAPPADRVPAVPAALPSTRRAWRLPQMPTAEEARTLLEENLAGLERAAQDREMLSVPEYRAVVTGLLERVQELLALDDAMRAGDVTRDWLRGAGPQARVARLCFLSLLPTETPILPPAVQVWVLTIDEAVRRWQYARRRWLTDTCGLTMLPVVAGVTPADSRAHEIDGEGDVVHKLLAPGFLLDGAVLRKARVRAG